MTPAPANENLPVRMLNKPGFALGWIVFLAVILKQFWWVRDVFLVWWVYGRDAYFREGVRVLPGKPIKFSNGQPAPAFQEFVTGSAFFFVVVFGLTAILIAALLLYERHSKSHNA